eukprot:Gb_03993 [translate_table: standard]
MLGNWVVTNSFYGLEGKVKDALNSKIHVHCIGPLLPLAYLDGFDPQDTIVGTSSHHEIDYRKWLDSKPLHLVIYVSFGSLLLVSRSQVEEITMGLKESECPFLWAFHLDKNESTVSEMLSDGFMEDTKEQGLIVSWSTQLQVLSHPSVGGFFSHYRWNSCIESISSGVPMLGFPLGVEQYTNAKLLANEWKIGVRLQSGGDDKRIIVGDEIVKGTRSLIVGEEMRKRAQRLREVAIKEVMEGGCSIQI